MRLEAHCCWCSQGDDTTLWKLDRDTFREILFDGAEAQLNEHKTFLTHVQLLSALTEEELTTIADALKVMNFSEAQEIIKEVQLLKLSASCLLPLASCRGSANERQTEGASLLLPEF